MPEYRLVNGRLMQMQPAQLQQGASLVGPPAPNAYANTLIGGSPSHPPLPASNPAIDFAARTPESDEIVMSWIRRAVGQTDLDPYTYLNVRRGKNYRLDVTDDNLAAAERYFDALQGNYSKAELVGDAQLKRAREVEVGGKKVLQPIFGKNGSKAIDFVTRWGMIGAFDRDHGITHHDRVTIGAP